MAAVTWAWPGRAQRHLLGPMVSGQPSLRPEPPLFLQSLLIRATLLTITAACAKPESRAVLVSLFRLHLIALPARCPRAASALLGWGTALSSGAHTQAAQLGLKNVSLTILGQSLFSRAFGP